MNSLDLGLGYSATVSVINTGAQKRVASLAVRANDYNYKTQLHLLMPVYRSLRKEIIE